MSQLNEYEEFVDASLNKPMNSQYRLLLGSIGLAGETGEVCEHIKKFVFHKGKTLNLAKLKLELGDVLWYLTLICNTCDIHLDEIIDANIIKLEERMDQANVRGS